MEGNKLRPMTHILTWLVGGLAAVGCGGGDAGTMRRGASQVSQAAQLDSIGSVTVLPCAAHFDWRQDPDDIAPGMTTSRLQAAFKTRGVGHMPVSQTRIDEEELATALAEFYKNWLGHPEEGDGKGLRRIALRLQSSTLFVAGVTRWKQTEKTTRVGMTAGLFDGATGKLLWWSEQERQEKADMQTGRPSDFVAVVDLVVEALLDKFWATDE
jgi:hypothetical protein